MTASIGSILSNARSALTANQAAINTTAHNIANAETPGFTRKRVDLTPGAPVHMPYGALGTGVYVNDIGQVRDRLLDVAFRRQSADASDYERRGQLLAQIEDLYGGVSGTGLSTALDSFWGAWGDLATNPLNDSARMVARQSGQQVAGQLQRIGGGLDQLSANTDLRLRQEIAEINKHAAAVARLNEQIVAAEATGQTAGDLRDARDRAVDAIAKLGTVQVFERADHAITVVAGDATIVDGNNSQTLVLDTTGGTYRIRSERGSAVNPAGGSLGAAITVLNTDIPAARAELDAIARAVVGEVNAVHATGTNPLGQTGVNFFDDFGDINTVTAANIRVSAAVSADPRAIAAGAGVLDPNSGNVVYAAGANDVAMGLAGLRTANVASLGNSSIAGFYASAVTRVGSDVRAAADGAQIHATLASQADVRRISVSGVSIDEELTQLIRFQNAYAAAARVITAADELFESVIGMMR
jgi:flagellar hook-associated protein 1 FlgK